MLILPPADETVRILSFDPGTDTLGLAVSDANLLTGQLTSFHVETFKASKYINYFGTYRMVEDAHGDRQARLRSHYDRTTLHLGQWAPHVVVSESPFMGMRAQAYAALVECVDTLRWALMDYNPTMAMELIPPMSAKKVVGASGRGKDKNDVKNCIADLIHQHHIVYNGPLPFDALDEHSIDAMAVGYAMMHFLRQDT